MRESTDLERAYVAGFFDGEGCISMVYQSGTWHRTRQRYVAEHYVPRAVVSQTNLAVLQELADIWGGRPTPIPVRGTACPIWQWGTSNQATLRRFLEELQPYLKVKAPQAKVMLAWLAQPKVIRLHRAAATKELLGNLNAKGPLAAERKLQALTLV